MENRRGPPPPRFTVSHDEALDDPGLRSQYLEERTSAIRAGEDVFMLSGFSGKEVSLDTGTILDYYSGSYKRGFIEGNELDGFQVYATMVDEHNEVVLQHLNVERLNSQNEAQKLLQEYIKDTL